MADLDSSCWRDYVDHLRFLILTADYPPANWSGIATAVAEEARALRAIGCDVLVLTTAELSARRFPVEVRDDDVVHLHSLALAELAIEMSRRYELSLLYTAHSIVELELGAAAAGWADVQRHLFEVAQRVIFVSGGEQAAALRLVPALRGRCAVVPNSAPPPPAPSAYADGGPIVFAGRFTRNKGIDLAAEVARAIDHPFVFAGGHGDRDGHELVDALQSAAKPGWISRHALDRLFAGAALVLVPSRYEPFGMVAVEAMRMGAPVLASTAGGLADLECARHVAQFDAARWIDACARLLDDVAQRETMHDEGPSWVARRFDAATVAGQLLSIASQTAGERDGAAYATDSVR